MCVCLRVSAWICWFVFEFGFACVCVCVAVYVSSIVFYCHVMQCVRHGVRQKKIYIYIYVRLIDNLALARLFV